MAKNIGWKYVTLRNPDTVESRIWEKLNHKIENVMLAFGHVMDEPEDLLQMVLGMTSPALFRELFAEASQVPSESMAAWFDQKAATFGGRDVSRPSRRSSATAIVLTTSQWERMCRPLIFPT